MHQGELSVEAAPCINRKTEAGGFILGHTEQSAADIGEPLTGGQEVTAQEKA